MWQHFVMLSRNKWTFKLQRRVPPVVAIATDNECSGMPVPARDKFMPLYLRVYFDAHIARASRFVLAVITTPRRLIHVRSYQRDTTGPFPRDNRRNRSSCIRKFFWDNQWMALCRLWEIISRTFVLYFIFIVLYFIIIAINTFHILSCESLKYFKKLKNLGIKKLFKISLTFF